MPRLVPGSAQSAEYAPVGPGVFIVNLIDKTTEGVLAVLNRDESRGRSVGAMTSAPSFTASITTQDRTENFVGLNAAFKNAQQIVRTDATFEIEFAELRGVNFSLIHPGLTSEVWLSSLHGHLEVGTGDAKFAVTALEPGTVGNGLTLALVKAGSASQPTSVAVAGGTDIIVTLGTSAAPTPFVINATANEVIAAINAHAEAKTLVHAGVKGGSDGTGVVAAAAEAPLAGGTTGTRMGEILKPTGYISPGDYFDNAAMCLEGPSRHLEQIWILKNVISTDEVSFQPDDEGMPASISATFTASVTDEDRDPTTGIYRPPYEIYLMDPVVAA